MKLRQQQAVLKKQEQDLTDLLHKKLGKQTELLNSLGLGTSALQPGASTAPNIGGILPAIPTPGSSAGRFDLAPGHRPRHPAPCPWWCASLLRNRS